MKTSMCIWKYEQADGILLSEVNRSTQLGKQTRHAYTNHTEHHLKNDVQHEEMARK